MELIPRLSERLGQPIASVRPIGGGRNSRVYQINCQDSGRYIAKVYPASGAGQRDRLDAEFSSLSFLWDNGLRCVPRPVTDQPQAGWAVYEFIEGTNISSADVTARDIGQAVEFLSQLKDLRGNEGSADIGPAAEACFSVQAIFDSIDLRLDRLISLEGKSPQLLALRRFLETDFQPKLAEVRRQTLTELTGSMASEIGTESRTLSPSDFGFHNALRRPNRELVFLDFEYFGWDDPAKMICDFLLHPAMELPRSLRSEFLCSILQIFAEFRGLEERVKLVYPVFALKWTLILLNEFVPERLERRSFAVDGRVDTVQLQTQQLNKARMMLRKAVFDHEL